MGIQCAIRPCVADFLGWEVLKSSLFDIELCIREIL